MNYTVDEKGNYVKKPIIAHLNDMFKKKPTPPAPVGIPTQPVPPPRTAPVPGALPPTPVPQPEPVPTLQELLEVLINNQSVLHDKLLVIEKTLKTLKPKKGKK